MRPSAETHDQTVSEIANEQTEAIKQIMASHRPTMETPILPEKERVSHQVNEQVNKEEQGPYEDFKAKCEYYFKIYNIQQKEPGNREDMLKQKPTTTHVYGSRYGTQPLPLPAVYIENQFNSKPTSVEPPKLEAAHEGTWHNQYYEYAPPYGIPNRPSNTFIGHIPYVPYPSSVTTHPPPVQQVSSVQSENQVSASTNVNSATSTNHQFGIIKEETIPNKYYEYVSASSENEKVNAFNVPYMYSPGYGNQPSLPFPVYAENHFNPKPTVEPFIAVPKVEAPKETITQGKYFQYLPYNVVAYPMQYITPVPQNGENQNGQTTASSVKQQVTQVQQSQYETNSEQKHVIHNSGEKSVNVAPLTLQNALVSDGKNVYYWYKSMPGYQVYVNVPYTANTAPKGAKFEEPLSASSQMHNYESKIKYAYVTHAPKLPESTTAAPTTTTTELVPSYEVKYSIKDKDESKEYFKHQLRFVYPVPVVTTPPKSQWRVTPYSAYRPQELQSSLLRMPYYAPTFQVIKALDIPNKYVDKVVAVNKK